MKRHRYFYIENGQRKEELIGGKWMKVADRAAEHRHIVISDSLPDVWNPATNKRYDSKQRYYRDTKAAGGEIVGNDYKAKARGPVRNSERPETTIERLNQKNGWGL